MISSPALRATLAGTGLLTVALGVVACSGDKDDSPADNDFAYVLNKPLATTNAASTLGVATDAAKLSARLYPGAYLPGPGNRLLPNTDLVSAAPVVDNPDSVDYTISDTATYSDGAPVVCDDFLLTWVAAHRSDVFASDPGLMTRVRDLSCDTGAKAFRVDFDKGMGPRFRELFGPGDVLPAHTVTANAGEGRPENVVDAVSSGDEEALAALGRSWSTTFDLARTDPATVPTYGPFRIESRDDDGSLLLSANPEWRGDPPGIDRVRVRGGGELPDSGQSGGGDGATGPAAGSGSSQVTDVTDAAVLSTGPEDSTLTDAGFTLSRDPGERVDGLQLSDTGVFATPDARRGFASCIDRGAVVAAVSTATGADASLVKAVPFRVALPDSPAAQALVDIAARNSERNTATTASQLTGTTVRIGYLADQPRYSAIVDALTSSCQEGGVSVVGVPLDAATLTVPGILGTDVDALLETTGASGRNPEVSASPVTPLVTTAQIRDAENTLADAASTVPLSLEPRLVVTVSTVSDVSDSGSDSGLSWNMDRWISSDHPSTVDPGVSSGVVPPNTVEEKA